MNGFASEVAAVRGENAYREQEQTPGTSGSFDSVNGLASESIHSAQDDSVKEVATADDSIKKGGNSG